MEIENIDFLKIYQNQNKYNINIHGSITKK